MSDTDYKHLEGEWGFLKDEPCRFCREPGGVYFAIHDGAGGHDGKQEMRCDKCKRTWMANEACA